MTTVGTAIYIPQAPRKRKVSARTIAKLIGIVLATALREFIV